MTLLRWPIALVLVVFGASYLWALAVLLPWWALVAAAALWLLLFRRRASVRLRSLGSERQVMPDAP